MPEIDSCHVLSQTLGDNELTQEIKDCRVLLVGAGGIGSEVIKNLLLMGFEWIDVMDLDTIDVSNLNRQFLFNRQHVGQSKAQVAARVAVDRFAHKPSVAVNAIHNSVQSAEYDIDFYKSHTIVINALDNRAARSHVNRMCLAADVPLIESGSEGYMGQVFLINKGLTQCYECEGPKPEGRTFASCTIRNTPSLPIHCIVWAKHLFAQLFGEVDADNDVSPDTNDPELANTDTNGDASAPQQSTRDWVKSCDYDTKQLFNKLFKTDIEYLLRMDKLWENRQKPFPVDYDKVVSNEIEFDAIEGTSSQGLNGSGDPKPDLKDQKLWSINECLSIFDESMKALKNRLNNCSENENYLVWDKDDESALDFVTAVSNLRSFCFHISRKSRFDVKSMAGNIIPAISSTNSIVGGLIVLQAMNVLRNIVLKKKNPEMSKEESGKALYDSCRHIYLRKVGPSAQNLISAYELPNPNPNCLVCSQNVPEIEISLSLSKTLLMADFIDQLVIGKLHFVCPDVSIDGQSIILFSKDDYDESNDEQKLRFQKKYLSDCSSVCDKTRLKVVDLIQDLTVIMTLRDVEIERNENEGLFYKMVITREGVQTMDQTNDDTSDSVKVDGNDVVSKPNDTTDDVIDIRGDDSVQQITLEDNDSSENGSQMEGLDPSKEAKDVEEVTISDSDSDFEVLDDNSVDIIEVKEKRKLDDLIDESPTKRLRH